MRFAEFEKEVALIIDEDENNVMMTIAFPSSRIFRRTAKSLSVSCGVRTAVGSSRIRISAPRYSTLTISTICYWDTDMS